MKLTPGKLRLSVTNRLTLFEQIQQAMLFKGEITDHLAKQLTRQEADDREFSIELIGAAPANAQHFLIMKQAIPELIRGGWVTKIATVGENGFSSLQHIEQVFKELGEAWEQNVEVILLQKCPQGTSGAGTATIAFGVASPKHDGLLK